MKFLLVIFLCCTLALTSVDSRRQNRKMDLDEQVQKDITLTITVLRNFWHGFQQELFNKDQRQLDSRCLDPSTEDEIAEIYYAVTNFGFRNTLDMFVTLYNLFYDDFVVCRYQQSISVFIDHCRENPEMCKDEEIQKHAKKSVFKFIVVITAIGDIFEEETDFIDPKVVGRVVLGIGKDVCKVAKMVLGMEPPSKWS